MYMHRVSATRVETSPMFINRNADALLCNHVFVSREGSAPPTPVPEHPDCTMRTAACTNCGAVCCVMEGPRASIDALCGTIWEDPPDWDEEALNQLEAVIYGKGVFAPFGEGLWTRPTPGGRSQSLKHAACEELERRGRIRRAGQSLDGVVVWLPAETEKEEDAESTAESDDA